MGSKGGNNSSEDTSHSGRTVGLAVGLGVGIPIFITLCVLVWVTIRHHRKIREEDELDKDIDFNGDVSFFSPGMKFDSAADNTGFGPPLNGPGVPASDDGASTAYGSEADYAASVRNQHPGSIMYTPELDFANNSHERFSRTINNVYGPSPAYPSTEKLRAPSLFASARGSGSIRSDHSSHFGAGPFATPPRPGANSPHGRRFSNSSIQSNLPPMPPPAAPGSGAGNAPDAGSAAGAGAGVMSYEPSTPQQPPNKPLAQLRESPHPYVDLAGNMSTQSFADSSAELLPANRSSQMAHADATDTAEMPREGDVSTESDGSARHAYAEAANPRESAYVPRADEWA